MLYIVNYANQCSLRAVILPISRLHFGIKSVVMEIFVDLRGDDSSSVFDRNERLEIGMYNVITKLVGARVSFLIRGWTIEFLKSTLWGKIVANIHHLK